LLKNDQVKPTANSRHSAAAAASRPHRGVILEHHAVEEVRQKHPLRHLLGDAGGGLRHGLRRGRLLRPGAHLEHAGSSAAAQVLKRGTAGHARRRGQRSLLGDENRAHAREVEAAQEGIGAQLAGAAQIDHELDHRVAHLAKLARELVGEGQFLGIVLAPQKLDALVANGMEQFVENPRQAFGFFLRVHALPQRRAYRERGAEHLRGLFVVQRADPFGEELQPVHLGEQHIDREVDAQSLGDISQPRLQVARHHRRLVSGLHEPLQIDANDGRARRLAALSNHRAQLAGLEFLEQLHPARGIGQNPAGGVEEDRLTREPDIGRARGHDIVVLVDLSGQQFRLGAGAHDAGGLGSAGIAD
jgi:hypothetical protein